MKSSWVVGVVVLVIAVVSGLLFLQSSQPGALDEFAACLKDRDAIFYGTFWCPHCQNQKKMFGRSARLLPYIECSTPDGQSQLAICTEKDVQSYPTWTFADGSRETGEVALGTLAEKTGCSLPK